MLEIKIELQDYLEWLLSKAYSSLVETPASPTKVLKHKEFQSRAGRHCPSALSEPFKAWPRGKILIKAGLKGEITAGWLRWRDRTACRRTRLLPPDGGNFTAPKNRRNLSEGDFCKTRAGKKTGTDKNPSLFFCNFCISVYDFENVT